MTPAEILELPLETGNDSGATTIRGFLVALLGELWIEKEGFSGKRPFGNSGWQWDLYAALGRGGAVPMTFDEYGGVDEADTDQCYDLIMSAIRELGQARNG
ncbi:hypothetical protein [Nocardia ignorata]|uniref:Uncharacterized protein n=1 Tax=Nocardia ignorata TaxID=145285 RepID=A0A4R6NZ94_NOCIG|nr:hypothetical protein [Nocardia ignorata]TDP29873.1 hypothetical protein DFR75_112142 [Nocardia ignorata]